MKTQSSSLVRLPRTPTRQFPRNNAPLNLPRSHEKPWRGTHLLAPSKSYKARRTATKHPSARHRSHTRRRVCFTPGTNSAITAKPSTVLTLFLPQPRKPRKCASRSSVHVAPKKAAAFLDTRRRPYSRSEVIHRAGDESIFPAFERERPRIVNNFAASASSGYELSSFLEKMNWTRLSNLAVVLGSGNEYSDEDESSLETITSGYKEFASGSGRANDHYPPSRI